MNSAYDQHVLANVFMQAVENEDLLAKKYKMYSKELKDRDFQDMLNGFREMSESHISLLKDIMIKLNIQR